MCHVYRLLYYLVCVFDVYDQISFSFSPVFPQLCVVAVKCPCIGVRAIVSLPIRTPWSVDAKAFSASTLFSASFVVSDSAIQLPLAGMSSWCAVVVVGFTYSPVNPLLLLAGHGIIVSSRRVVGCLSSSDPPLLFRFPRFSIKVSTCCLEEVPGV